MTKGDKLYRVLKSQREGSLRLAEYEVQGIAKNVFWDAQRDDKRWVLCEINTTRRTANFALEIKDYALYFRSPRNAIQSYIQQLQQRRAELAASYHAKISRIDEELTWAYQARDQQKN